MELGPDIVVDGPEDVDQDGYFGEIRPPVGEERVGQDLGPEFYNTEVELRSEPALLCIKEPALAFKVQRVSSFPTLALYGIFFYPFPCFEASLEPICHKDTP